MPKPLPRKLVVAIVATAASCGPSPSKEDGGVPDAGSDAGTDAGMVLCPSGCFQLMRDGGPVFYEDGGPYCLC